MDNKTAKRLLTFISNIKLSIKEKDTSQILGWTELLEKEVIDLWLDTFEDYERRT